MTASRSVFAVAVALALFALTGCSSSDEARDAGFPLTPVTSAVVLDMPSGFVDVAFGCQGPVGVYVAEDSGYNGSDVAVVADDPACAAAVSE